VGDRVVDEVSDLGYDRSYPSFTRALRLRGVRPACEPCHPAKGRPMSIIDHPACEETLCRIPHRISYGEHGNMRRRALKR
jgi:hypothetical protein